MDSSAAAFWEERYQAQDTPWDMAGPPPPLHRYLQTSSRTGSVTDRKFLLKTKVDKKAKICPHCRSAFNCPPGGGGG